MTLPGGMLLSSLSLVWGTHSTFWKQKRLTVTLTDLLLPLSSDLVGSGAGRAGEATETEEQAGAGHRHNGPEQLRDHPTPPSPPSLHSSSPSVSLPRSSQPDNKQNSNPQQYDRRTAKGLTQNTAKWGGSAEMGGPVYAYMCLCVFVCSPIQRVGSCLCERLGHQTFSHTHTWRNMSTDSIWLLWILVFVVCLILISGVLSWWSDGQERNNGSPERNSIYGTTRRMDQSVTSQWRKALSVMWIQRVTVLKDVRFFSFSFLYRCNQLPTLWSLATCITAEFAQFTETLQRKTI